MDAGFRRLQDIPQYRELKRRMSLSEFQAIFWWDEPPLLGARDRRGLFAPVPFFLWRGMWP